MPIETFNYLDSLNASYPASTDNILQGADHIRGIKTALKNTFPNITAAITVTQKPLNLLGTAGSLSAPSVYFSDDTLGFFKNATGLIGIAGQLVGNGAKRTGALEIFIIPPSSFKNGGDPTGTTKYEYLELDGGTYLSATYPELYNAGLGIAWGSGSTFTLPNVTQAQRTRREATITAAVRLTRPTVTSTLSVSRIATWQRLSVGASWLSLVSPQVEQRPRASRRRRTVHTPTPSALMARTLTTSPPTTSAVARHGLRRCP